MIRNDRYFWLAVLLACFLGFSVKSSAQGEFGNSPANGSAFDFVADGGIAGGGAVAFTPTTDLTIGSVTVWLTHYTGRDMNGHLNQGLSASIRENKTPDISGGLADEPGMLLTSLNAPKPNDGSLAAFTFADPSPATVLLAHKKYWLFIYELTSGSVNQDPYPQWVEGAKAPTGDAIYNGSSSFWDFTFSPSNATPAFTLNPVPEPGFGSVIMLGLCLWGICCLRQRQAFCRNAIQAIRQGRNASHRAPI